MAAFAGIIVLYSLPFTVMGPVSPRSWILTKFSSGPLTHSDPASGGNTAIPSPACPWHMVHLVLKSASPGCGSWAFAAENVEPSSRAASALSLVNIGILGVVSVVSVENLFVTELVDVFIWIVRWLLLNLYDI